MGIVYGARNKVNGKWYIGKTVQSLHDRKLTHERDTRNGSKLAFHRAIRKYGADSFEWSVLAEEENEDDLFETEQAVIKMKRAKAPNGYNLTDGGEGKTGWKMPDEVKQKIGSGNRGKERSPELRKRLSEAVRGFRHTEEAKRKIGEASSKRKRRRLTEEEKRNISEKLKGRHPSDETREKLRLRKGTFSGHVHTEETKQRISRNRKGKGTGPRSEKARANMKAASQKRFQTSSGMAFLTMFQEAGIKAQKGRVHSEEERRKQSESLKKTWADPVKRAAWLKARAEARSKTIQVQEA